MMKINYKCLSLGILIGWIIAYAINLTTGSNGMLFLLIVAITSLVLISILRMGNE